MRNVLSTCTKTILFTLILLGGCKEFYNEEFQEDPNSSGTTTTTNEQTNTSYEATLASTMTTLTGLTGTAHVTVNGNEVDVNVQLNGIPDNLLQVHYGYIAAACNTLNIVIPNSNTGTRTYALQETTTLNSLQQDLATSGASSAQGDIDLSTKSFVVKAFSSLATGSTGTAGLPIMIACGDLNVSANTSSSGTTSGGNGTTTSGTTGTVGTGTATTGTIGTGTATTGTIGTGTATTGTIGTDTGTIGTGTATTGTIGTGTATTGTIGTGTTTAGTMGTDTGTIGTGTATTGSIGTGTTTSGITSGGFDGTSTSTGSTTGGF